MLLTPLNRGTVQAVKWNARTLLAYETSLDLLFQRDYVFLDEILRLLSTAATSIDDDATL